jgi:hypothetical protein
MMTSGTITGKRGTARVFKTMIKLLLAAATGMLLAVSWPDIRRYVTIRQASAGTHPEKIPAHGRIGYPQNHAAGAVDGTGDFESAQRGGPVLS